MLARGNEVDAGGGNRAAPRRTFTNRWLTGHPQMDEEAARRHRQRMFQMGLLVCLVLLFVDQKDGREGYQAADQAVGSTATGTGKGALGGAAEPGDLRANKYGGIPEDKAKRLNAFLNYQSSDGFIYPKNATGYYRGSWQRMEDLPPAENQTVGGHVTLHHQQGRFDMQLFMSSITGIPDLSLVYGYFKLLDGQHSSDRDIYSVAKGVYVQKTGRLLLRSMTQTDADTIALTFTLPPGVGNFTENAQRIDEGSGGEKDDADESNDGPRRPTPKEMTLRLLRSRLRKKHEREVVEWVKARKSSHAQEGEGGLEKREDVELEEEGAAPPPPGMTITTVPVVEKRDDEATDEGEEGMEAVVESMSAPSMASSSSLSSSVLIPNRPKTHYIRQTTTNARKCVFQLDAIAGPCFNASDVHASSEDGSIEHDPNDKLRWVEDLQGTLTSPNCRVAMNVTTEAIRLDWGRAYKKAVNYSIVVTLVCVMQIALLFRQLYFSRTQAAASRVSLLTIGQQAILDALLCIAHLLLCAMLQPLFAAFASIAFFKLVIFSIFEIRYMFIIHQSRSSQSGNAASFNGLRRQLATLHARFYAILFFILFVLYFLSNYLEMIILVLYSFWVPQIVMNAHKGVRQPLNHTYVLGMSIARLIIPLYLWGCPENFVHLLFSEYKPHYRVCVVLVLWVALQVAVLLSQDVFGPQYMIPSRFLPPKYNYYRPLPQSLLRSQSTGDESAVEMTDVESGNLPECVICYNSIETGLPNGYMVSPCDHLFHKECLERWLLVKLECPICRAALPPAD